MCADYEVENVSSSIKFNEENMLADITGWALGGAEVLGNCVIIHHSGEIEYQLTGDTDKLISTKHIRCVAQFIDLDMDESYGYTNLLDITGDLDSTDDQGNAVSLSSMVPMNLSNTVLDSKTQVRTAIFEFLGSEYYKKLKGVTMRNNSGHDIRVINIVAYASDDLDN